VQNTFDQNNTSPIPGWIAHQGGSASMNSRINQWGVAQFNIAKGGAHNYNLQLWQDGLSIEKGSTYSDFKEYFIQFTAEKCEPNARFSILMGDNDTDVYIDWATFKKICSNGKLSATDTTNPQLAKIYPNPASDYVNVQLYENIEATEISIFDIHGRLVQTQTIHNGGETSVDVSKLDTGSYFIRIQSGDAIETQKILKY